MLPPDSLHPSFGGSISLNQASSGFSTGTTSQGAHHTGGVAKEATAGDPPITVNTTVLEQHVDLRRLLAAVNVGRFPPETRFVTVPEMLDYYSIDVNKDAQAPGVSPLHPGVNVQ